MNVEKRRTTPWSVPCPRADIKLYLYIISHDSPDSGRYFKLQASAAKPPATTIESEAFVDRQVLHLACIPGLDRNNAWQRIFLVETVSRGWHPARYLIAFWRGVLVLACDEDHAFISAAVFRRARQSSRTVQPSCFLAARSKSLLCFGYMTGF